MNAASQPAMAAAFKAAMLKLSILGHKQSDLIDCSDVIPTPLPLVTKPHLPAGQNMKDIEQGVSFYLFYLRQAFKKCNSKVCFLPIPNFHCRPRSGHRCSPCVRIFISLCQD